MTEELKKILDRWGKELHHLNSRMKNSKVPYEILGMGVDEGSFRMALDIYAGIWKCYVIYAIRWEVSLQDIHPQFLYHQPVCYHIIIKTSST